MKKTISSFLLSIFVLGAIPLTSSSCCTHEQLKIVKKDLNSNKCYVDPETFTTDYSIVSSLKQNGKISKQKTKKLMDQIITNDYIETRVSDIVDKTAAEINTFGKLNNWSEDKIQSTVLDKCGTFLANYNAQKDEINSNDDYANDKLLEYINMQASALNIDAFDYYQSVNMIKSIESSYSLQLQRLTNLTSSEKIEKINAFNSIYDNFLTFAKSHFLSSLEFNYEILNLCNTKDYYTNFVQPLPSNCYSSYEDFYDTAAEKQLFVLTQLFSNYFQNGNLSLIDDGSNFIKHIKQYSSDGYLSDDDPYVHTEDLTDLFSFTYDNLQGVILSLPNYDYLIPTQQGDLTDDIGLITTAPISKYTTKEGSTYELGELYPGYKAHFRVSAIDYSSKESECNLNLEIGVSDSIRDPKDENILWTTEYCKQVDDDRVNPENAIINYTLSINKIDDKRYIASHYFYNNWTTNIADSKYNKELDEYFTDTVDQRPYLDELLDRNAPIENDEYVISEESPLYLTADDVKGVPMPNILLKNPTSIFPTFHTPAHASQYLRFMVTDYSTAITGEHKLSLYGSWVVISTTPSIIDEDGTLNHESYVYKLPWKINNSNTDDDIQDGLWVSYTIDQELLEAMEIADKYGNFIESYIEIEPEVLRLDKPTNSKNSLTPMDAADKTAAYLGAKIGLDVAVAVALGVGIVVCVILTDLGMAWKAVFIVLFGIALALVTTTIIIETMWFVKYNGARTTMEKKILPVTEKWTEEVHKFSDDIITNYDKLKNRKLTFSKREEFTNNLLHDFGIDREGNIIDSDRVNTISDWVRELYDTYDKKFSETVAKLTDNKFIYFWKHTPNINLAKSAIDGTFALTILHTFATVAIIAPTVAGALISTYKRAGREVSESEMASREAQGYGRTIDFSESETINQDMTNVARQETSTTQAETVVEEEEEEAIDNELYNALGDRDPFNLAETAGTGEEATALSPNNTLGSFAGVAIVIAAIAVISVIDLVVSYIAVLKSK